MPNLWCKICRKHHLINAQSVKVKFAENVSLKGHISSEHDKNKSYKCPICVVLFAVNITLKGHISSEHDENKSCKFPICVVIFASNITLKGFIRHENICSFWVESLCQGQKNSEANFCFLRKKQFLLGGTNVLLRVFLTQA